MTRALCALLLLLAAAPASARQLFDEAVNGPGRILRYEADCGRVRATVAIPEWATRIRGACRQYPRTFTDPATGAALPFAEMPDGSTGTQVCVQLFEGATERWLRCQGTDGLRMVPEPGVGVGVLLGTAAVAILGRRQTARHMRTMRRRVAAAKPR